MRNGGGALPQPMPEAHSPADLPVSFSSIRDWLASSRGQVILNGLSRSILHSVLNRHLSLTFLNKDVFGTLPEADLFHEVRSELTLFLLESPLEWQTHISQQPGELAVFLRQRFVSHWIARSRSRDMDPWRYLYKRVRDILDAEEGFYTRVQGRGSIFTRDPGSQPVADLCEDDLLEIPFPREDLAQCTYDQINRKKRLIPLAERFWEGVCRLWNGQPVWVSIRDFMGWLGLYIPFQTQTRAQEATEYEIQIHESLPWNPNARDPDHWDPALVQGWAARFACTLSPKEKRVFLLRHGENRTLKDIARETGHRGSSGVSYVLEVLAGRLRIFLADLPWLSPDDLHQEAFSLFRETLLSHLKKEPGAP